MTNDALTVDLGDRAYPIHIGSGQLNAGFGLESHLRGNSCLVVSNETVAPLYLDKLLACLGNAAVSSIELPDGEAHKTFGTVESVLNKLVKQKSSRDVTVIALGGGVVGDIAGFAASCYMRGVGFIQIPTTLLAQVDSSVGGKTGVNHPGGKNLIGAFYQPQLVLIDTDTLSTLPDRELSAGLAEVIKYGAIADLEFFEWLEDNMSLLRSRDPDALQFAIRRSCELKAEIVAEDEREAGKRALLNFGHTFGHAIENSLGYGEWLHGEAVGVGMLMAATLGDLDSVDMGRLKLLISAAGLPTKSPALSSTVLADAMKLDKKVTAGKLRFILLCALGDAFVTDDFDHDRLMQVLEMSDF